MRLVRNKFFFCMTLVFNTFLIGNDSKIVGLMQVRNESHIIEASLRALAVYVDAIVVLDDASEDETVQIIEDLSKILNIVLLKNQTCAWQTSSEKTNRQRLLSAGREIGGTHFILLDADEMFAATCMKNNWLRKKILELVPGQVLCFPMINLWNGTEYYRNDLDCNPFHQKWRSITAVFCDDKMCSYEENQSWAPSGTIHVSRVPCNRNCLHAVKSIGIKDLNHALLHFKYVDLEENEIKKVWYMCLEFINANKKAKNIPQRLKNAQKINTFYTSEFKSAETSIENIKLRKVSEKWLAYSFFENTFYKRSGKSRKSEVIYWLNKFGKSYFAPLKIWHLLWINESFP